MLEEWPAAADRAIAGPSSTGEALAALRVPMMQHLLCDPPSVDVSEERHVRAATRMIVAGLRAAGSEPTP
jgi:hypothetical protein